MQKAASGGIGGLTKWRRECVEPRGEWQMSVKCQRSNARGSSIAANAARAVRKLASNIGTKIGGTPNPTRRVRRPDRSAANLLDPSECVESLGATTATARKVPTALALVPRHRKGAAATHSLMSAP